MAKAKQPVMINDIEFDALITEEHTYEATVPEYATEEGFSVSDAVLLNAETLKLSLFITETPVTWVDRHGSGQDHVDEVCKQLEELYYAKEPVTVVTNSGTFNEMLIESITLTKSPDVGYAREIPISLKKLRVTKAETTTIPDSYGKSGKTGENAGTASTSRVETPNAEAYLNADGSPKAKDGESVLRNRDGKVVTLDDEVYAAMNGIYPDSNFTMADATAVSTAEDAILNMMTAGSYSAASTLSPDFDRAVEAGLEKIGEFFGDAWDYLF